jgi:hypothetical protein
MLAFAFEGELLSNKLVGSALPISNVIRCFYILDLALSLGHLLLTVLWTMMVLRSYRHLHWREAGPTKKP